MKNVLNADVRPQSAGISSSPFFFTLVITVVMADETRDHALSLRPHATVVERQSKSIGAVGLRYGLELHGSKFLVCR